MFDDLRRAVMAEHWAIAPEHLEALCMMATAGYHIAPRGIDGEPLERSRAGTVVRNGVAVIPIVGPITPRSDFFTAIFGEASVEDIESDLRKARDSAAVDAILFDIDSPGGVVTGIGELADEIFSMRGQKPIVAYAYGMAASAAFWIGTAADDLVTSPSGLLGSVGTVLQVIDMRRRLEEAGIDVFEFVSSQLPNKRPDPKTEQGAAQIQARVDALAEVFIQGVGRNLGISRDEVVEGFDRGSVKVGQEAVDAGMASRTASRALLLAELEAANGNGTRRTGMGDARVDLKELEAAKAELADARSKLSEKDAEIASLNQQLENRVKESDQAVASARVEGAEAERSRIRGLEEAFEGFPGHEKLLEELKADGKSTKADAAEKILAAEKTRRSKELERLRASDPGIDPPTPSPTGDDGGAPTGGTLEERCKAAWDQNPKLREEYVTFDDYVAFKRHESKVRILKRAG